MIKSGIYKITNTLNGKSYIGSSVNLVKRKNEHFRRLRKNIHENSKLQNAWIKYGETCFIFEIILECPVENLLIEEQTILDEMNSTENGYNICPTAGNTLGAKHTEESKLKISKSKVAANKKGTKRPPRDPEWSRKISEANSGRPLSDSHKLKISEANKGKPKSKEHNLKVSMSNRGKPKSEKHMEALRAGCRAYWDNRKRNSGANNE
jgi:group I intron endonuclease